MLDAIVIGTGFGGAVSACRLAQAGLKVQILERGRRYPRGSFPRDWKNPKNGWLWEHDQGLFDVKPLNEMTIVQGAGYGGGSLIYANVHLRPVPSVFDQGWPARWNRQLLDPYYDLVAYMLDIRPITAAAQLPPKTQLMKKVAQDLGRAEQFCYPNIAVDFSPAGQSVINKHGVAQEGCTFCGECDIGCNIHAKNTLDLNYLALAERAGAAVATQAEVFQIEPLAADPAAGYRVRYRDHTAGGATVTAEAKTVFVCAGAVNSTELLLRCRDQHKTLPRLGEALGERYSGNGDLLAFAFKTAQPFEPSVGPTITTGIVVDEGAAPGSSWFIFEEGGCPKELAGLLPLIDPGSDLGQQTGLLRDELMLAFRARAAAAIPSDGGAGRNQAVFLAMGLDRANGRITLGKLGNLFVKWDVPSNLPLYDLEERIAADVAKALGGHVGGEPLWDRLRLPVTVHNLGGCVMSDEARGVTDNRGEVRGYPGLFVLDGAALPEATGVNPSHTIAAAAERNVELAIQRLFNKPGWTAPERAQAKPIVDPVGRLTIPAGGTRPPATPSVGISFSESLHGHHAPGIVPETGAAPRDAFIAAATAGKQAGRHLEVAITITASNVDRFLAEPAHAALLTGKVRVDGFTEGDGAAVTGGTFNLYPETPGSTTHKLAYLMPFVGADGKDYLLDGEADVVGAHGGFDPMATSTVYALVREGASGRSGRVLSAGVFRLGILDLIAEMKSLKVLGTDSADRKRDVILRFLKAFMGPVAETVLGGLHIG